MPQKVLIFIVIVLSSCSRGIPDYESQVISPEKRERIESTDSFLDLFSLTETIELDLDYGLWPFRDFVIGDKYLIGIVAASNMRAYAWHRESGRFLGELAPYGKGPGEALSAFSAVFIDNSTAFLFDAGLMRATTYRLTPEGFFFDDVIDTSVWSSGSIDYMWEKNGRIYLFNQGGGVINTYRIIIMDKSLKLVKKCFPKKQISYGIFDSFVISGDRIFMTDEFYHKDMKRDPWAFGGGGRILVSDLEGNLLGKILLPFDTLIFNMIPDNDNETFFMNALNEGNLVIEGNGTILKKFGNKLDTDRFPWLKTSLPTQVPRGKMIYVDRGTEGKLILRIFEYDV